MNRGLYFVDFTKYQNMSNEDLKSKKQWLKFSLWVFSFFLVVLTINVLLVLQICLFVIDRDKIIGNWHNYWILNNGEGTEPNWDNNWRTELISGTVVPFILLFVILCSLTLSIIKSWKEKSYRYISFLPTLFFLFQTVFGLFSLFRYLALRVDLTEAFNISWVYLMNFIMIFVYPVVWFFISRNVAIIRRIYMWAEAKSSFEMQNQEGQSNNPFGINTNNLNNEQVTNNNSEAWKNDIFYLRLKNFSRDQINELAKQLSISDYENMSDDELIKIIVDIRNVQNNDVEEKEIKLEEKNDENETK